MNYYLECEISQIEVGNGSNPFVKVRLAPTPAFIHKEGENEFALLVGTRPRKPGQAINARLEPLCSLEFDFDVAHIGMLTTCRVNRTRLRVVLESDTNGGYRISAFTVL